MNTLFLLMVVFGVSIQQVCKKAYNIRVSGGAYSFSAASALFAVLFFLVTSGGNILPPSEALGYSLLFAASYSISTIGSMLAICTGPLALTSLILQYSLVLPALYGLIVLDEAMSAMLILGIVMLLVSLVFINIESKGEKKKITLKWGIYAFLSFAGNGACSIIQKEQQMHFDGLYKNEFMILALFIVVIVLFASAFITERDKLTYNLKKGVLWYAICGLANGAVNMLVLVLSLRMPASVMFPVVSAGGIILTAAISILVYKEKLSTYQIIGMILGTVAIVFLNL